jgi:hypothetical protein
MLLICAALTASAANAVDETGKNLAKFVKDPYPWLHIAAHSEQHQPVYLGATPREIALRRTPADGGQPALYEALRKLGESEAKQVRGNLAESGALEKGDSLEFEAWPTRDEYGQLTWVFARWRPDRTKPWQRLNAAILQKNPDPHLNRWPVLPVALDPAKKADFSLIFDDASNFPSLYAKPLFGDCIWATNDGTALDAWLSVEQREAFGREVAEDIKKIGSSLICRVLPQPARLNGKPVTFIIRLEGDSAIWPKNIQWKKEDTALPALPGLPAQETLIKSWPKDFGDKYKEDVLILSGEKEAVFPASKRRVAFKNKNSVGRDNQLQDVVMYLEERYKELGIKTWRQDFAWRGTKQTNLVAVIPGSDPSARPVILADHIDTAFSEDVFNDTGKRAATPGADDNASATAALLGAAPVLRDMKLNREIWIVHLTGAEFPADSLGARYFVSLLLKDKKDIEGAVLLDMIGYWEKSDKTFSIDPGEAPGSLALAKTARDAAKAAAGFDGIVRTRFNEESQLYNTDGLVFSDAGFPVVLLTEHLNKPESYYRRGFHRSTDGSKKIDWSYASDIAKAAIETVAAIANKQQAAASGVAKPDWSIVVYVGADERDLAKSYNPRLKELFDTPVPDNIEVLIERDTDWPDGTARIIRSSDSHEERELGERDSSSAATFYDFLKWTDALASGRHKLLIVHGNSQGWLGMIRDQTVPGKKADSGPSAPMPLSEMARAVKASGFQPDVAIFDAGFMGNVEAVEELKDIAPYIVVSGRGMPYSGFSAEKLFKMAAESDMSPRRFAQRFPEEYVREYAHDGSMPSAENDYFIVTLAAIDTAKWSAFSGAFKELTAELQASLFRAKLQSQPGWMRAFVDKEGSADLVEFLNRLPLLIDDRAVRDEAAAILDDIGYPDRVAAENAATVTLDPEKVRSFELRIEVSPFQQRDKALGAVKAAWNALNQDLSLPDSLTYDLSDFREDKKSKREFIVRCSDGAMKKPLTFRPWFAGSKYAVLTAVDKDGKVSTRKLFRERDYVSVTEFPETSFMVSEAHSQGVPFVHGIGIALDPGRSQTMPTDPNLYKATSWNKRTGWGDI